MAFGADPARNIDNPAGSQRRGIFGKDQHRGAGQHRTAKALRKMRFGKGLPRQRQDLPIARRRPFLQFLLRRGGTAIRFLPNPVAVPSRNATSASAPAASLSLSSCRLAWNFARHSGAISSVSARTPVVERIGVPAVSISRNEADRCGSWLSRSFNTSTAWKKIPRPGGGFRPEAPPSPENARRNPECGPFGQPGMGGGGVLPLQQRPRRQRHRIGAKGGGEAWPYGRADAAAVVLDQVQRGGRDSRENRQVCLPQPLRQPFFSRAAWCRSLRTAAPVTAPGPFTGGCRVCKRA